MDEGKLLSIIGNLCSLELEERVEEERESRLLLFRMVPTNQELDMGDRSLRQGEDRVVTARHEPDLCVGARILFQNGSQPVNYSRMVPRLMVLVHLQRGCMVRGEG